MFIIRQAQPDDLDDLYALARQTYFINLPPDREIIAFKIEQSLASFRTMAEGGQPGEPGRPAPLRSRPASKNPPDRPNPRSGLRDVTGQGELFLLVLEERAGSRGKQGGVVGTSQVVARMGGPGHPRYYMTLKTVSNQSRSLGVGWTHLVGTMGKDETGPTEIGGLILNHAFRGHPARLGRFLSFARFHLIGLHRRRFSDTTIAEMLGPITRTGYNPFYEKFTRHFVTRAFADVYRFSQTSREFLDALMPRVEIFLSILDPEVANAAGEVGDDTRPARRLLERLGFEYHHRIDPLDGGPHLEAKTDAIVLVRDTRRVSAFTPGERAKRPSRVRSTLSGPSLIASIMDSRGRFTAVQSPGTLAPTRARLSPEACAALAMDDATVRGATQIDD